MSIKVGIKIEDEDDVDLDVHGCICGVLIIFASVASMLLHHGHRGGGKDRFC